MSLQWMENAKCKDQTEIEFFPEAGRHPKEALAFCQGCKVRRQCFDYAIKNKLDDGVWGGVTANRRNIYRRRLAKTS